MHVLILGGDGYLAGPTALHLTAKGHEVTSADSCIRRRLSREEELENFCFFWGAILRQFVDPAHGVFL